MTVGMVASLDITGLIATYRDRKILDGLDLAVAPGEILVLLGPSGAGKTTLLRVLGGFLAQDAGRVLLGGADITALPPHRRPVSTMFQSYALFPHMDVAANIGFGLRRQGRRRHEVAARVAEMLRLVRLDGFGARRINELSGGQQQRVALARALAPAPQLLLLDEPLSALDPDLRVATRGELAALLRRAGTTSIMVTHDQEEALALADQLAVLHQGRIVQRGAPRAVYERPQNSFVARFLGGANLLVARVDASGPDGVVLAVADGKARTMAQDIEVGAEVVLALRPEHLALEQGKAGPNRLVGRLAETSYGGAHIDARVVLPSGVALRLRLPASAVLPAPGASCVVSWAPDAALVLRD